MVRLSPARPPAAAAPERRPAPRAQPPSFPVTGPHFHVCSFARPTLLQERQLSGCLAQLAAAQLDYDYVRDQVTTTEVSLARIYNYDVMRRKEAQALRRGGAGGRGAG